MTLVFAALTVVGFVLVFVVGYRGIRQFWRRWVEHEEFEYVNLTAERRTMLLESQRRQAGEQGTGK